MSLFSRKSDETTESEEGEAAAPPRDPLAARQEFDLALRAAVSSAGLDPDVFLRKSLPQSQLFMVEMIPIIHQLYFSEPMNVVKSVLDVGPQTFGGTALLAQLHSKDAFTQLKMEVDAIDIHDKFSALRSLIAPEVGFVVGDIFNEKRRWDLVIASHVIEHVERPDEFCRGLQRLARDYVVVACPWDENPIVTQGHINTIDKDFVRSLGASRLEILTNYSWGKQREVCIFVLKGLA